MPEPVHGQDTTVKRPPIAQPPMAELRVRPVALSATKTAGDMVKTPVVGTASGDLSLDTAGRTLPELKPASEVTLFSPHPVAAGSEESEGTYPPPPQVQPLSTAEPPATPSRQVKATDPAQLPIVRVVRPAELPSSAEGAANGEKPLAVVEQQRQPTLLPSAVPSTTATSEARTEQRVTVHIGAIEIRALPSARSTGEQPVRPPAPPPAPAGFDGFTRLRSYAAWLP